MIPGAFPARVVEVRNDQVLLTGQEISYLKFGKRLRYTRRNQIIIDNMLDAGMSRLCGVSSDEAWRLFFDPSETVGIKVVPVGGPEVLSSYELVNSIINKLIHIGVKQRNVIVFDRFKSDFIQFGYDKHIKSGTRWECSSEEFDFVQLRLDGKSGKSFMARNISGYSADHFFDFPVAHRATERDGPEIFRSHLCCTVANNVDKMISIPVLKDHVASGITFALKNLSHGLFNNVYRTHRLSADGKWLRENCCEDFIPAAAAHATVREKAVLFIGDSIMCAYHAGPGAWNPHFSATNRNALLFATDPVAMDTIGIELLNEVRKNHDLIPLEMIRSQFSTQKYSNNGELYPNRHVAHVSKAAALSLGSTTPKHEIIRMVSNGR